MFIFIIIYDFFIYNPENYTNIPKMEDTDNNNDVVYDDKKNQ